MLIKEYFKGQEIFITGGSGFIGKALIEKLIRSCGEFSKIYVLLRPKKGKSESQRLSEILQTKFFERARLENPAGFANIEAIAGDCAQIDLGMRKEDLKRLENVTIIYHSAASVKFDDPLSDAVLLNTRGTWELLKIAETLKNLQVFLHVSTAYCNAERLLIEEKVYDCCADWRETITIAEHLDQETLDIFNLKISEFKPNTYCFTKALSEQVVNNYKEKVPVTIFRPAVVTNCLDDPYPGWIDNFNGPMGMLTACGIGINRYHNSDGRCLHSIVPIDIVVRGMIMASYKKGLETIKNENSKYLKYFFPGVKTASVEVYNCSIDKISPIAMADLVELGRLNILKNPYEQTIWVPGGSFHSCPFMFQIKLFMVQLLMAVVVDCLLRLNGQKPMLLKLQRKIRCAIKALNVFVINEWDFKVEQFFGLDKFVPLEEHNEFAFLEKSRNIDFDAYVCEGIKGSKEYLLNENRESSPAARKRLMFLKVAYYTLGAIIYLFIARFLFNLIYAFIFSSF